MQPIDVAIIGAGPYGLSLAAHLAGRASFRIFGSPMTTWRTMFATSLKSQAFATSIPVPKNADTFPRWCAANGLSSKEPVPISVFARYGMWMQKKYVPSLEETLVTRLGHDGHAFTLRLETGEELRAQKAVCAVGLTHFARLPREFDGLDPALVSHTSAHSEFSRFKGQAVAVLGAGQSALEASVLLAEAGARPELIIRRGKVSFGDPPVEPRPLRDRWKYPQSVLGPGRMNWVLQHLPLAAHYLDDERRVRFTRRWLGPSGSWWLRRRFEGVVPLSASTHLEGVLARGSGVVLRLRNGAPREATFDHVVCGTGYESDVARLRFLDEALARRIALIEKAPRLDSWFESSVPGLHFIGQASAFSFGPLFRFVAGASFATPRLARRLLARRG